MGMGSFHVPQMTLAWPTGEFGPMGLEGAVRFGYAKELAAGGESTPDGDALFNKLLQAMIDNGKALNAAMYQEIDAVIDPRDTRAHSAARLTPCRWAKGGQQGGGGNRPLSILGRGVRASLRCSSLAV